MADIITLECVGGPYDGQRMSLPVHPIPILERQVRPERRPEDEPTYVGRYDRVWLRDVEVLRWKGA